VMLLKGTQIGSGSIIGAGAVCAGKKVHSNTSFAGNPARLIRENVFFTNKCVHSWTEEISNENEVENTDEWTYSQDKNTVRLADIDSALKACKTANEKLSYIKNSLPKGKNRFYVAPPQKKKNGLFSKK
ncbi:acyltransferase, partial [Eubacterium sp.]|uniref:acyltransferase n=1 Tax=Eubacterium sp. TaxID=142586 RepID=UPI003F096ADE